MRWLQEKEPEHSAVQRAHRAFLIEHLKLAYAVQIALVTFEGPLQLDALFSMATSVDSDVHNAVRIAAYELRYHQTTELEQIFTELVEELAQVRCQTCCNAASLRLCQHWLQPDLTAAL